MATAEGKVCGVVVEAHSHPRRLHMAVLARIVLCQPVPAAIEVVWVEVAHLTVGVGEDETRSRAPRIGAL